MKQPPPAIPYERMDAIFRALRTPRKYGAVVKEDGFLCDSPVVFRLGGRFYMTYVRIDGRQRGGYCTCLAESDDLLRWRRLGRVFGGTGTDTWDAVQAGGYAQLIDADFGRCDVRATDDGRFLLAYIGGDKSGYETDPLSVGLALTDDFSDPNAYRRAKTPVLSGCDPDARPGETLTIYKPHMFVDEARTLGHRFVCAYNAKDETHRESIFLAVSDDGLTWRRYGAGAVLDVRDDEPGTIINGDPQIIRMDDLYVMAYYVYDGAHAYDTFAVSRDLLTWQRWRGEPLIRPTEAWEDLHAHKPWIIRADGVVFHYYCAVNTAGERFIALAVSENTRI